MVNIRSEEEVPAKPIWKGHLAAVGTLFIVILGLITFAVPQFTSKEPFTNLLAVQQNIQKSGLVHVATVIAGKHVGVNYSKQGTEKTETTYLAVNAVLKHRPSDPDAVARQIASIILKTYPQVSEKDSLVISTTYGYDIGITTAWQNQNAQHTPHEWQELLRQSNPQQNI